jgi:hypothetical protein
MAIPEQPVTAEAVAEIPKLVEGEWKNRKTRRRVKAIRINLSIFEIPRTHSLFVYHDSVGIWFIKLFLFFEIVKSMPTESNS